MGIHLPRGLDWEVDRHVWRVSALKLVKGQDVSKEREGSHRWGGGGGGDEG